MSAANVCKTYNNAYQAVCIQGNDRTVGFAIHWDNCRELKEADSITASSIALFEEDSGLRRNDCDRRNGILIPDEGNPGQERLVAIDLEDVVDFWAG